MDFKQELLNLGIELTESQENKFLTYYTELVRVNEYMNLTAITEKEDSATDEEIKTAKEKLENAKVFENNDDKNGDTIYNNVDHNGMGGFTFSYYCERIG